MAMPGQQAQEFRQFKGLILGVDRKRIIEPFCVDGRDFIVDIDGPVSALSTEWIFTDVAEPRGWQTLENEDESTRLHFTADAICQYDVESRQFYPVFAHATRDEFWPWFRAMCGGILYLSNKEVGLVSYDPDTGQWALVTGDNIPATVFAMCSSGGRLILVGPSDVRWSDIDDGSNTGFTPDVDNGAGAQGLSILSSGTQPLRAVEYEFGFMVFTRAGIVKFEHTNTRNPFRWTILSRHHRLLNPWCMAEIIEGDSQQQVFLTERGLFTTKGSLPQPWQPVMSEYLRLRIIPTVEHDFDDMTFRMDYSKIDGWLMISIASNGQNAIYDKAYILHSDEWGVYSRAHTGFGEISLNSGVNEGVTFGVCDTNGTVSIFSKLDHNRVFPEFTLGQVDYRMHYDLPSQFMGLHATPGTLVSIMRDMLIFDHEPVNLLPAAGVYDVFAVIHEYLSPEEMVEVEDYIVAFGEDDEDWELVSEAVDEVEDYGFVTEVTDEIVDYGNLTNSYIMASGMSMQHGLLVRGIEPTPYDQEALNAEIVIGPFYVKQEENVDYLSQLQTAIISMLDAGLDDTFEDYLNDYANNEVVEDWLSASGDEDWGFDAGNHSEYTIRFFGTLDGYQMWEINDVAQEITPEVQLQEGKSRMLAGVVTGMYLYAHITTPNLGETFHLKLARLHMTDAGRLF